MAKKKTKTSITKKACQQIQQYARLAETDLNGYGACVSCGKVLHYSDGNGGHYQPKGANYNAASVDERNVHFQCVECNCTLGGNPAGYTEYMTSNYGNGILDEIFILSKQTNTREMMQAAYDKYRALNKELAKTKMFPIRLY